MNEFDEAIQRMQDMIPRPEGTPESAEQFEPGSDAWWDAHMRDKMRIWYSQAKDPHDTGALAGYLGMTFGEFANWFSYGVVPDHVKRWWAERWAAR